MADKQTLHERELTKKIRTLDYNVRRRLNRVANLKYEKFAGKDIEKRANIAYAKINSDLRNLSKLNYNQKQELFVKLNNVNNMKSSTVKGYKTMYGKYRPMFEKLVSLDKVDRDKISKAMELVNDRFGGLYDMIKYSAYEQAIDLVEEHADEFELAKRLTKMLDMYMGEFDEFNEDDFNTIFYGGDEGYFSDADILSEYYSY